MNEKEIAELTQNKKDEIKKTEKLLKKSLKLLTLNQHGLELIHKFGYELIWILSTKINYLDPPISIDAESQTDACDLRSKVEIFPTIFEAKLTNADWEKGEKKLAKYMLSTFLIEAFKHGCFCFTCFTGDYKAGMGERENPKYLKKIDDFVDSIDFEKSTFFPLFASFLGFYARNYSPDFDEPETASQNYKWFAMS